ncbi:MAG: pyridoxal 5'-phosphate synthase glutaminase subunit PdxT [Patescibacteria group bacterium]|nr:pyridoxal 5'-phosphate synthase glutaminase subunit PdxT [Patescibacteria group bacterium]
MKLKIGVLAFHGDVIEHILVIRQAAKKLKINIEIIEVRVKADLAKVDGLIIPGGESTTLYKLCQREGMWGKMKQVKNIFGTCAGAIMLAKNVIHKEVGQQTLELMDIKVDRNAYGRQTDSFEKEMDTKLGRVEAVFIRAPRIKRVGTAVKVLARNGQEIVACEQYIGRKFYLATCFHPELTTTIFHEYWLKQIL